MEKFDVIVVFDTEFVSSKRGSQPFQVSMSAYQLNGEKLVEFGKFSIFITLKSGLFLNEYVKEYTGISDTKLKNEGIYPSMAKKQLIDYLLSFNFKSTIFVGWAIANDLKMFDLLLNDEDEIFDVNLLRWVDLGSAYATFNGVEHSMIPALKTACEKYGLKNSHYHDASGDVIATAKLLEKMISVHGMPSFLKLNESKYRKKKYKKVRENKKGT